MTNLLNLTHTTHKQRTPHRRVSLSTIARLLELASTMGRLSMGCPP